MYACLNINLFKKKMETALLRCTVLFTVVYLTAVFFLKMSSGFIEQDNPEELPLPPREGLLALEHIEGVYLSVKPSGGGGGGDKKVSKKDTFFFFSCFKGKIGADGQS